MCYSFLVKKTDRDLRCVPVWTAEIRKIKPLGELMALEEESIVREWLDSLSGLNAEVKKMFGCYCLYCDGQAVGWIHDSVLSLREVGLSYLPADIKRPAKEDKIKELVIPLDYVNADWLPRAVQDTADIRKKQK